MMKKFFRFIEKPEEEITDVNQLNLGRNKSLPKPNRLMMKLCSELKDDTLSAGSSNSERDTPQKGADELTSQQTIAGKGLNSIFGHEKKKAQILMNNKQMKTKPNFRTDSLNALICSDIIFALISANLNSISEIVYNFTRETKQLYFLSENLPIHERRDMAKRAFLAKENAISLYQEIVDKRKFLQKYKQIG
jgi:hypothetical protein